MQNIQIGRFTSLRSQAHNPHLSSFIINNYQEVEKKSQVETRL